MAYTAPVNADWATGEYFTSAHFIAQVLDNIVYLKSEADAQNYKTFMAEVVKAADTVVIGTNLYMFAPMPLFTSTWNLNGAWANVFTPSSSGLVTVTLTRYRPSGASIANAAMLSTPITIDATEYTSYEATTDPVINTSNDDVTGGDFIGVNVTVAGTDTKGLWVGIQLKKA